MPTDDGDVGSEVLPFSGDLSGSFGHEPRRVAPPRVPRGYFVPSLRLPEGHITNLIKNMEARAKKARLPMAMPAIAPGLRLADLWAVLGTLTGIPLEVEDVAVENTLLGEV